MELDDELQTVVDRLAERLRRSVAVDDPAIQLLAASRHFGDEDQPRVLSVVNRGVSPDVSDLIAATGVATLTEPARVVIAGSLPRVCVPVRCDGMLLGYLWLIDNAPLVTDAEIEMAAEAAERAGVILFRRLVVRERSKARHEAILRELVASDDRTRARAVDHVRAEQLFSDDESHYQVIAIRPTGGPAAPSLQEVALEAATESALPVVTTGAAYVVADRSQAWIVLARRRPPSATEVSTIADRIVGRFQELTHGQLEVRLGMGSVVDRLDQVVDSYHEAVMAVQAAHLMPSGGPLTRWEDLGPYRVLLKLPTEVVRDVSGVPALVHLQQIDSNNIFMETLEVFLDNAGDVKRTAERLCIHRATLYHRLRRIEDLTGCDLNNGLERLALHMGLKLRLLAGPAPSRHR